MFLCLYFLFISDFSSIYHSHIVKILDNIETYTIQKSKFNTLHSPSLKQKSLFQNILGLSIAVL